MAGGYRLKKRKEFLRDKTDEIGTINLNRYNKLKEKLQEKLYLNIGVEEINYVLYKISENI